MIQSTEPRARDERASHALWLCVFCHGFTVLFEITTKKTEKNAKNSRMASAGHYRTWNNDDDDAVWCVLIRGGTAECGNVVLVQLSSSAIRSCHHHLHNLSVQFSFTNKQNAKVVASAAQIASDCVFFFNFIFCCIWWAVKLDYIDIYRAGLYSIGSINYSNIEKRLD